MSWRTGSVQGHGSCSWSERAMSQLSEHSFGPSEGAGEEWLVWDFHEVHACLQASELCQVLAGLLRLTSRKLGTCCVRWQLRSCLEHPSGACVLNSGTSSSRPFPKAYLEFNSFISLKCCSEFRLVKRQSSDSDGNTSGNSAAPPHLQVLWSRGVQHPDVQDSHFFKLLVVCPALCELIILLSLKSIPSTG